MKSLTSKLFTVIFLLVLSLLGLSKVLADPVTYPVNPPPPPSSPTYSVISSAQLQGVRIAGLQLSLSGNGQLQTQTTSASGDTVFSGLPTGSYTLSLSFPANTTYQILTGSGTYNTFSLSDTSPSQQFIYQLQTANGPQDANYNNIKSIVLPSFLTKAGNTTTDFSKLDKTKLATVNNFTFDDVGNNKIVYNVALNLSNFDDFSRINQLGDFLNLEQAGKIDFNPQYISPFQNPATLTMYNIKLVSLGDGTVAIINKDGNQASPSDVSNISYINNNLSFSVKGFSTYALMPRLKLELNNLTKDTTPGAANDSYTTTGSSFNLKFLVDNLDAKISVYDNGQSISFPSNVNGSGEVTGNVNLNSGVNRIRVVAELANGQKTDQFFTVTYSVPGDANNSTSKIFGVTFFLLILIAGILIAIYYLVKGRKKAQKSPELDSKPDYNSNLLTPEEKILYNVDSKEDTATKKAMDYGMESSENDDIDGEIRTESQEPSEVRSVIYVKDEESNTGNNNIEQKSVVNDVMEPVIDNEPVINEDLKNTVLDDSKKPDPENSPDIKK